MSLDLVVRGDPEACRAAAHRLMTIAAATRSTGDDLARAARVADPDFGGLSGDAFRDHARSLATSADDAAQRCRRVARGLSELALDLEDARRAMGRARASAEPWLVVTDGAIQPPGPTDEGFPEAARTAWQVASELVTGAREIEARAQHDWCGCVWQVAEGLPIVPYDPLRGPHLPAHPAGGGPVPEVPVPSGPSGPGTPAASGTPTADPAATAAPVTGVAGPAGQAEPAGPAGAGGPPSPAGCWAVGHDPVLGVGCDPAPPGAVTSTPPPVTCGTPTQPEVSDGHR